MKKRTEWKTKRLKRIEKKKDRGIVDLMMIMHHFFKDLPEWIDDMTDPYNAGTVMALCRRYGWRYLFTQKSTRQKNLGKDYEWIKAGRRGRA